MTGEFVVLEWVPAHVAEAARRLYETANPNQRRVIERLAQDQRMQQVWKTLRENPRGSPKPVGWPKTVEERERRAAFLFECACETHRAFTDDQIGLFQERVHDVAGQFEQNLEDFLTMRRLLWPYEISAENEVAAVESLIAKCRAAAVEAEGRPRVSHKRKGRQRGYLIALVDQMRVDFGSVMRRTVATIASVALRERVTERMVERAVERCDS